MIRRLSYFLLVLILVIADQVTKAIVVRNITLLGTERVIPGFFNLTYIRNRGAIFGFFSRSGSQPLYILLTLTSLVALSLVIYFFFKTPRSERLLKTSLSLILGGALGNMADRIFRGYVVDFLDFYIKGWHWPSFNVADSCITIGAFLLIFILLFKKIPKCSQS